MKFEIDELPDVIRLLRIKQGWTQQELASLSGIPANTLGTWERGLSVPRVTDYARLLEAMDYELHIQKAPLWEQERK